MIGKPEWFTYRKFGWGLAPKTWQGWAYISIIALLIGFLISITLNEAIKVWVFGILFFLILADMMHIMIRLPKVHDERENLHQLIIERNCSFAAVATLAGIALYQTYANREIIDARGVSLTTIPFDVSILIVILVMVLVKTISTYYVKAKM